MTKVIDPTMVIEAITELHSHDKERLNDQPRGQGHDCSHDDPGWFRD